MMVKCNACKCSEYERSQGLSRVLASEGSIMGKEAVVNLAMVSGGDAFDPPALQLTYCNSPSSKRMAHSESNKKEKEFVILSIYLSI